MKKIKIFSNYNSVVLESDVNDFLKDHHVVDIQYRVRPAGPDQYITAYSVMIIYNEWQDVSADLYRKD